VGVWFVFVHLGSFTSGYFDGIYGGIFFVFKQEIPSCC
jgi:hypothetical protein